MLKSQSKTFLLKAINKCGKFLNFEIARAGISIELSALNDSFPWYRLWAASTEVEKDLLRSFLFDSKSQLGQDLFVIRETSPNVSEPMTNGYFVEFGATNGVDLSNTWLLEKRLGWQGILAEPCQYWHTALRSNRECHIDFRCVTNLSGDSLTLIEPGGDSRFKELSTLKNYEFCDVHQLARSVNGQRQYEVETVSLSDLLACYGAPHVIDYLSIDTEGNELEIISALDLDKYSSKIITIEHK